MNVRLILVALCATAPALADMRPLEIDDYFDLQYVGSPTVSPDSQWVAFTVSGQDLKTDSRSTRIWMIATAGGVPQPVTQEGTSAWSPRWSPDGEQLSFLAGSQVHTFDVRRGDTKQLTDIERGVESFEWSPDGKRLALTIRDESKDIGDGPWVMDRIRFKSDYVGYLDRARAHVYSYDIETGSLIQLTAGDYEDYSQAWSPDGRHIAFVSNRAAEPDLSPNTDIWLVDPNKSHEQQVPQRVTTNPGSDDSPLWHPEGDKLIYITAYTDRTDVPYSYLQSKVAVIEIGEDEPRLLTTDALDRKAYGPVLSPDGSQVYVMIEDDGRVDMATVALDDGELRRIVTGQVQVNDIAVAPDGRVIASVSKPRLPGELFVVDAATSEQRQLTYTNAKRLESVFLSDVEELRFPTLDGTEIQTFVYKPQDFEPTRRYPTILWLHGGQESQYDYGFNFRVQLFAANGYVVVMPNVRGSGGRGQEFALALNKSYGVKDVEDVIVATDYVIEQGYADPDRLGIGGWSSGGTLTNFVITKTQRFKGAISGASVGWYTSTYGHDPYVRWWHTELGAPWENRELWDSISPFMGVDKITTPTLFIGGEKDWNQPIIHSEQMYQAMKFLGREASLVVYPNAHHGIRRPVYHRDLLQRFVGWFDQYVKNAD